MKKSFRSLIIVSILTLVLGSCGSDNTTLRKNITGNAGELVVVISKDAWDSEPGKVIRETMAQPQVMLPQEEPLFNLVDVPHNGFKQIFRTTRNIIRTSISPNVDEEGVSFTDDVWAYPQATVQISAKSPERFVELFNENKDKIISYFLAAEKERNTMNYNRVHDKAIYNTLNQDFGFTMKVPPGFRIVKKAKDFIWIQFDTPEIFQGIVIYTYPFVSDSAFTVNYQLPIRDSLLKAFVEGPTDGSYMTTEKRFDQVFHVMKHNGNYAAEMRGLWRLENDFMGGPYVALSELDLSNQRVINAFGFVYAPSKNKRNLLRQVEAMIYSLKLNNQADNDKLNKQADLEIDVEG